MPKYELVITNDNDLSPLKPTPLTISVLELTGPQGIQGPEGPRGLVSVTDNGGDGSLEYEPIAGVLSYTGPSAEEVRAHFSNGTGVTITDGQVAIGQPVATTDDVTFNTVSANLTGNADTADALTFIVRNSTGATLTKGTAVYVSGIQGNTPEVSPARADNSATMPAFGLVQADIAASGNGVVTTFGSLLGLSVANFGETGVTFSLGDTVYISATEAGKLTNAAPAGEANSIQNIGKIERATPTTNMTIKVGGAGRTNATPNLGDGRIFIGNSSNQAVTSDLNSEVRSRVSASGDINYNPNTGNFSFTERTDDQVRGLISHTDNGGDGSLSYDSTTGIISYTGPNASEVRAHFSGGTGVSITNGEIAIGQAVGTSNDVTFNDVTVSGDLTVNGSTTTIDTTNLAVKDSLIELSSGLTAAAGNDAGLIIERGTTGDNAFIGWDESANKFTLGTTTATGISTGSLTVITGTLVADIEGDVTGTVSSLSNHDTGDLAEGTNLYYTQARFDTAFGNKSTSDLSEGTNLYYTDARADARVNTANVTAAGALMDSEVTNLAQVKAFDSADYATAAQGALADTAVQPNDSPTFGTVTADGLNLGDNEKVQLGASNDLQLYYDSTGGYIAHTADNSLIIENRSADRNVVIRTDNGSGATPVNYLNAHGSSGELRLFHYGNQKLATKTTGVDVTGDITVSGTVDGRDIAADGATLEATTGKAIAMAIVFGG